MESTKLVQVFPAIIIFLMTAACAPTVVQRGESLAELRRPATCDVAISAINTPVSESARRFGSVEIGDPGFTTECGREKVLQLLRESACQRGADLAKITSWKSPDWISTCYRIEADLYSLDSDTWETIGQDEHSFTSFINANADQQMLAPIEGIWATLDGEYVFGIMRDDDAFGRDYVGFILRSEPRWWTSGQVKLTLERTAHAGVFLGTVFGRDRVPVSVTAYIDELGVLKLQPSRDREKIEIALVKKLPVETHERPSRQSPQLSGTRIVGTCFAISGDGDLVTNYHVVGDRQSVDVGFSDGRIVKARIHAIDPANDLALLRADQVPPGYLALTSSMDARPGQRVFTFGFPASAILGSAAKYTDGSISAMEGLRGAVNLLQISVPVQPGNSGGPLVDESGRVIGVVTSTAAVEGFLRATGSLPQNVNWAVKSDYVALLAGVKASSQTEPTGPDIVEKTAAAVCSIRY